MSKPTLTNTIEYIKALPDCAEKFEVGQENSVLVEMSLEEYKNYQNFKKAKV